MGRCYEYINCAHCRDDIASLTNKEIVVPLSRHTKSPSRKIRGVENTSFQAMPDDTK
jgi:hypothetical protein